MARVKHLIDRSDPSLEGFEIPEGLVPVALFDRFQDAGDAGLIILAMGKAYWTLMHEERFVLCVAEAEEALVSQELEEVARLGLRLPRLGRRSYQEFPFGWLSFALYALVLVGCFVWQYVEPIEAFGRMDAERMMEQGEWWRAVTALTLHADLGHLASNMMAGIGFAFFLARFFGAASAWLLILLSGGMGNALNAWIHYPEPHFSMGASTAVFGALGLLTGVGAWMTLVQDRAQWFAPRWFVPVFGGVTLLGLLGVGGENVDVAAHISGFGCGCLLGVLGALGQPVFVVLQKHRIAISLFCLFLVFGEWVLAFY